MNGQITKKALLTVNNEIKHLLFVDGLLNAVEVEYTIWLCAEPGDYLRFDTPEPPQHLNTTLN